MAGKYEVLGLTTESGNAYLKKIINGSGFEFAGLLELEPRNLDKITVSDCDAIIIYSEQFADAESNFVEKINRTVKDKALILITGNYDVNVLTKAMECGITKVISKDDNEDSIYRSIVGEIEKENIATVDDSEESEDGFVGTKNGKTISVFGTKGGTGKSTVSVNLATALQEKGKDVVLIDLDLQFGDVGIFMNVPRFETISDLVKEGSFSRSSIKRYLYKHNTGVSILCAPASPELAEIVKPEHISMIADVLKKEFDYIIFDMSPTIDEFVLHALDISDSIYFVTNPEISTLKNTKVCLDVLKTLGHFDKVKMVLNKDGESYIKRKDMESTLNKDMDLVIPRDSKSAISAINRGIPLVDVAPRSKASKAILNYVNSQDI
ncbi:hypothetical protein DWW50_07670 [Eubacterium sp. AF15-50]|uniref:AAA family ATPase n=1 Tax=Eubacterium segne TaxID=2763045 RepID=A0ABR7F238_9FIRM|nr:MULTISPECIES: AAA family ATPase [Eubacterium]MBC5667641.1 AAA family ATPase [Eubacterium segne]RHR71294.1 hypothetical protein DWW68_08840 [Eubacterium sp. AF16-48]RHR79273.1 hypothetical protein DWW50_07670 [Eubacterium sp. AF15-50]